MTHIFSSGPKNARRPILRVTLTLAGFLAGAIGVGAQTRLQPPLAGAAQAGPREGSYLYRFAILQAAPGRLVELIDLLKAQAPLIVAGGDEAPYIVRHSQGDHWDLVVILPMRSFADYFRPERIAKREAAAAAAGLSTAEFDQRLNALLSWDEDLYVLGPPVEAFRRHVEEAGLLHFEMMQELPGKREALVEERRMENAFQRERGRYETLIFVRAAGAAWDVVTLAVYRNWRQYAESELIAPEASDEAARRAGFESAAGVGPYMRTLISTHRDTLGPPVRWESREP